MSQFHDFTPVQTLQSMLRQATGPLTRQLEQVPAGAGLGRLPLHLVSDSTTRVVCGFCSTGCSLNIHLKAGRAVGLTPAADYPVNLGMACPKGWEALEVLNASDRAVEPLLKNASGNFIPIDWDTAADTFVDRFRKIIDEHGPESVAFLSTGQIVTEEMALLGAFAKFGMGIVHGDGNTRQCMATSVVAYKQSFGFDSPPYTYADFEESDVIVLIGSNLCIAHPIMWERVMRNPHKPAIIIVDPRRTETAMAAQIHAAIRPKSDLPFLYGIAHALIKHGWIDRPFIDAHTNGFAEFQKHVEAFDPEELTSQTGVLPGMFERIAQMIHDGKRVSFWWTMGVNQSHEGVRTAQAIINLALMTGNIGRPGTGANSITGQCNAMGSRLFSNTTNLLGGHDFTNAAHREKVAAATGIDVSRIPQVNSLDYHQIVEGVLAGKIKGLWIIGTNSAHSWIHSSTFAAAAKKLDFLVVQDMYTTTETAKLAHLFLPAAAWGEKDGTFINSERRIGLVKKVQRAPGQALADFSIFRLLADRWGCGEMFKEWNTPAAVFQILKRVSVGQPCDISGIKDYADLEENSGIQWPFSRAEAGSAPVPERRLFSDGRFFHADGRAKFIFDPPRRSPEPTDREYPFTLLTGRGTSAQWHTQTRTSKSAVLRKLYPEKIYVEVSPEDAKRLGIEQNEWVIVESRRGQLTAKVFVTPTIQRGQVFIPMHYAQTNLLTQPVFDPFSKQPSYKACAVRLLPREN